MAKRPRPYSLKYTARQNPRRYLLSGIPPMLWERIRKQAKKEGIALRALILQELEGWLACRGPRAHADGLRARERRVIPHPERVRPPVSSTEWIAQKQPVWAAQRQAARAAAESAASPRRGKRPPY